MNLSQLIFNFPKKKSFKEEDFIFSNENKIATDFLTQFFKQKDFSISAFQSAILMGENHCGKTFLLNIFAKKFNATFIEKKDLKKINLSHFFEQNKFYIIDDIDKIKDDELLFHLINSAIEAKAFLLMSAKDIIDFKLKDLVSRIKNIFIAKIENPQEEMLEMLVVQGLAKKQLKVTNEVINFLVKNLNRNYKQIFDILNKIEIYCHKNKKKINLEELKKMLH